MKILTEKKLQALIEKALYEEGKKQEMNRMLSDVQEQCMKLQWRIERLENGMLSKESHAVKEEQDHD